MALSKFTDSAGREAYKDERGQVFTEGGKTSTGYNESAWNQRQQNKYGVTQPQMTSFSPSTNFGQNYSNISGIFNQSYSPIEQALQKSRDATAQSFDVQDKYLKAQEQPMKDRYQSLLSTLKGNQQTAEKRQSIATTSELGRRGISMDSGVAQQQLANEVNPITESYSGESTRLGIQQESDLLNLANLIAQLPTQRSTALSGMDLGIAQGRAGNIQNILNLANTLTTGAQKYNTDLKEASSAKDLLALWEAKYNNKGNFDPLSFVEDTDTKPSGAGYDFLDNYRTAAPTYNPPVTPKPVSSTQPLTILDTSQVGKRVFQGEKPFVLNYKKQ